MPPRAKFTKEEVIDAAMKIVETNGSENLTARMLGAELNSSTRPIFTVFDGMDDVLEEVYKRANAVYGRYINDGLKERLAFRGVGLSYIRFASEHPQLFRLLFMKERSRRPDAKNILRGIEEHYEQIMSSIVNEYGISDPVAEELYFDLWVFSHGIAVMTVTGVCKFSENRIEQMLTDVFTALLAKIKTERIND